MPEYEVYYEIPDSVFIVAESEKEAIQKAVDMGYLRVTGVAEVADEAG